MKSFKDCHDLDPEYASGWCGYGSTYLQPFLLT